MNWIEIALGAVLAVFAVAIILVVLLQESQQQNPGNLTSGSSGTFFSEHQSLSVESFLAKWTKIIAISFFLLVIGLNVVSFMFNREANSQKLKEFEKFKEMTEQQKEPEPSTEQQENPGSNAEQQKNSESNSENDQKEKSENDEKNKPEQNDDKKPSE